MSLQSVTGPPRRDPLFLTLCLFALVIAEVAERGAFVGVQVHRAMAAGLGGVGLDWSLIGPLFGGILAYFVGRHVGLVLGGLAFLGGVAWLESAPGSLPGLGLFTLGHGLLTPCLLALAALWLPNQRGSARLALFYLVAIATQTILMVMPNVAGAGDNTAFLVGAFAALSLMCGLLLAGLDFWAGRGFDLPRKAEAPPGRPQWEALGLLLATGTLAYGALGCAFQQQQQALQAWQAQGVPLGWLPTMGSVFSLALMVVGILLALMGTFMGLPRIGLAAVVPFTLVMGAIAILCGAFLGGDASSAEPRVAVALFSAMAAAFLQMGLVPLLATLAGGANARTTPLFLGLYLGLGGPFFGRLLGQALAGSGTSAIYPFAFLLTAAAVAGHLLGRRADEALENAAPAP